VDAASLLRSDIADVVLIDSRTGVAEMSGVCTRQLADVVVMLCAPNDKNLEGGDDGPVVHSPRPAQSARPSADRLLMVPARVDVSEGRPVDLFEERFRISSILYAGDLSPAPPHVQQIALPTYPPTPTPSGWRSEPEGVKSMQEAYAALAAHLVALSPADSALKRRCRQVLQDTFGLPTVFITCLDGDGAHFASELRLRLDRAGVIAVFTQDRAEAVLETAIAGRGTSVGSAAMVLALVPRRSATSGCASFAACPRAGRVSVSRCSRPFGRARNRPRWASRAGARCRSRMGRACTLAAKPCQTPRATHGTAVRSGFVGRIDETQQLKTLLLAGENARVESP
jgi:hypothetical protein